MYRFVARANIDNYLGLLNGDIMLSGEKRSTIMKLLIAEEDTLSHDLEQLEFAETRVAKGREQVSHARRLRDTADPAIRDASERLVVNVECTQQLLEHFCHQLRAKVTSSPL